MDWRTAALTDAFACVVNGFDRVRFRRADTAVVYGAGPMGLFWITLLRKTGARKIISVELAARRREIAKKMGADVTIDPATEDPVSAIMRETGGIGADVAVEVIGKVETVESAIKSTAHGGRVVIMGTCRSDASAKINPFDIMRYEKDILGSHSQPNMRSAIEMLDAGFVPTNVMVSHELPLQEINKAFELIKTGECVKAIINL